MFGITNKGGGGSLSTAINGSKKKYYAYAGQDIKKGDFVHFQTGVAGVGAGTAVWRGTGIAHPSPSSSFFRCLPIDKDRILVMYLENNTNIYKVVVVTIDGVEMKFGTSVQLPEEFNGSKLFEFGKAGQDKAVCAYVSVAYGVGTYETRLTGCVISISGTTCSVGALTNLKLNSYSRDSVRSGKMAEYNGMMYMTYTYSMSSDNSTYMYVARFRVSGTTLVVDSIPEEGVALLTTKPSSTDQFDYIFMNGSNKILYVASMGSDYSTSFGVFTLGGAGIKSTSKYQSISYNGGYNSKISLVPISKNQACLIGKPNKEVATKTRNLMGILINADDTVTFNNSGLVIENTANSLNVTSNNDIVLGESRTMLNYTKVDEDKLIHNRIISMNGAVPSMGSDLAIQLPSGLGVDYFCLSSPCRIVGSKVFIAAFGPINDTYRYQTYGMVLNAPSNTIETINYLYEMQVRKATSNDDIQGVSIEDAKGGVLTGANAAHNQACDVISITSPS